MAIDKTIPVRVTSIQKMTNYILTFELSSLYGTALPPFSPGSHICLYLDTPKGRLKRNYSLIGDPDNIRSYHIAVRLNESSSGGSEYLHRYIKVGDELLISFPKNHFNLSFQARHHLFYAAGIGITPFISMMAELKKSGGSFELHYAAKSMTECAFYDYLKENFGTNCHFYFSNDVNSSKMTPAKIMNQPLGTHVYVCGPHAMIEEYTEFAYSYGYPRNNVHYERFVAPSPKRREAFVVELNDGTVGFEVPAHITLLEALHNNGINVPYSCRVGRCGTCEIKVAEGEVDHFDSLLNDEERNSNKAILACVSRARSEKLVLDFTNKTI